MSNFGSDLSPMRDPRLAPHATGTTPVWLWSADASRVLWANPAGAAIFNAGSPAAIAGSTIDPKSSAALQIARIAGSLAPGAAPRLERLRGFGGRLGEALLCACSRITLGDGTPAVLVLATSPAGPRLPVGEQARRLLDRIETPAALFGRDGSLLAATAAARTILADAGSLSALGAGTLAAEALTAGRVQGHAAGGSLSIERIGKDDTTLLLALFAPAAAQAPAAASEPLPPAVAMPPAVDAPPLPEIPVAKETPVAVADQPAAPAPAAPPAGRRPPLRFVWEMDAEGRFTLTSEEFIEAIGPTTAAALGRPWNEVATALDLDPNGQVARAVTSHETWSGIVVSFPADGRAERLATELSGLPVFDRDRSFRGYRGFGICRDVTLLSALLRARRDAPVVPPASSPPATAEPPVFQERPVLTVVPPSPNVVPFRASQPGEKAPSLTPVERKAFGELASRLTARLRNAGDGDIDSALDHEEPHPAPPPPEPPAVEPTVFEPPPPLPDDEPVRTAATNDQREILDRLPVGVLVYRLDNLLYANRAFLDWTGYGRLDALAAAGGLDALFVEPGVGTLGQNGAKSLAISTQQGAEIPVEARLFSASWDGESALVLMLAQPFAGKSAEADASRAATAEASELRTILDVAADGVLIADQSGRIVSLNRRAETLFGAPGSAFAGLPFSSLFVAESQSTALDLLARAGGADGRPSEGREVLARGRDGEVMPLFATVGRLAGDRLCAVFQDIAPWKKAEEDLVRAKEQAEKASSAKSDFLAKISHEIRTPLNAIIGFSEVMMEERFGAIGNERYKQYIRDIHTSGEHVIALLNDLLDLSKIEAGKLELDFAAVDLNALTQQCVALMQPQAGRARIIIRTALAPAIETVTADARSVRQIVLNLLSNSIKFTGAGGQVIVSTATTDTGDVVLRVRDTGIGMSEKDIAVAMEPFRQLATSVRERGGGTGLGLPLTKALAEANRATFSIKSAVNAGTLVEVAFPRTRLAAE